MEGYKDLGLRIWSIVKHHPGPGFAILQAEVAGRVGTTTRVLRMATLWLLENDYPVAATTQPPYGLYRMTKREHQNAYAGSLWSRISNTRHRAQLVEGLRLDGGGEKQLGLEWT